jgi:hypothetical protein
MSANWPSCDECRKKLLQACAVWSWPRTREDVQDLAQEVCVDCLEGRVKNEWTADLRTWQVQLWFNARRAQTNRSRYQRRRVNEVGFLVGQFGNVLELRNVQSSRAIEAHAEVSLILAWADQLPSRMRRGSQRAALLGVVLRRVLCGESMREALRHLGSRSANVVDLLAQLRAEESS